MECEKKHVLVVDDDIALALLYQELLLAHGYQASTAANGREALKLLKRTHVDAIFCDLNMPELAGDLFYHEVGRLRPELLKRFIFVSAYVDNPLYALFLKSVQTPVLGKPAPISRMLETLKAVLEN